MINGIWKYEWPRYIHTLLRFVFRKEKIKIKKKKFRCVQDSQKEIIQQRFLDGKNIGQMHAHA